MIFPLENGGKSGQKSLERRQSCFRPKIGRRAAAKGPGPTPRKIRQTTSVLLASPINHAATPYRGASLP